MEYIIKDFHELSKVELYNILDMIENVGLMEGE